MVRAFAVCGIHVPADALEQAFEEASAEFAPSPFVRVVEKFASDPDDRAFVLQNVVYPKDLEAPYPEAYEVLSILAPRYKVGVIANQSAGTWERLEHYDLTPFISICLSSTEIGLQKPHPAIFRLALEQAQCEPHQAVMIGDRIDNDIRPAKLLGWRTIRVLQGFTMVQVPRNPEEEPDVTVNKLKDILTILC